jgi:hypothetical protein
MQTDVAELLPRFAATKIALQHHRLPGAGGQVQGRTTQGQLEDVVFRYASSVSRFARDALGEI